MEDLSILPPFSPSSLPDYMNRLHPVLNRHGIEKSGVVQLRDALYCYKNGVDPLSEEGSHTSISKREDYRREGAGITDEMRDKILCGKNHCIVVDDGTRLNMIAEGPYQEERITLVLQAYADHFFDARLSIEEVALHRLTSSLDKSYGMELVTTNDRSILKNDAYCYKTFDMTPTAADYLRFIDANRLTPTEDNYNHAALDFIMKSGYDPSNFEEDPYRIPFRFRDDFKDIEQRLEQCKGQHQWETVQHEAKQRALTLDMEAFPDFRRSPDISRIAGELVREPDICAEEETGVQTFQLKM